MTAEERLERERESRKVCEFGLGRARGVAWPELLRDYDVREGRVWALVLLWAALGPATVRSLAVHRAAARTAEV